MYISENIQEKQARHAGNCSRNKYNLISNVFLWFMYISKKKKKKRKHLGAKGVKKLFNFFVR